VVIDRGVLERNIAAMATAASARGLRLRPHVKTHKCIEIARLQLDAGATGITVATVSEAETFVAAGFDDVFIAYPLWVDAAKGARLRALGERALVRIGVDSAEGAAAAAAHATSGSIEVLVEIDSGHHRTGCLPAAAGDVALAAVRAGLVVRGIFTFPGHSYAPGAAATAAAQEADSLALAAESVAAAGIACEIVSGGSTPTAALTTGETLTEMRPGVYVFNDAQQLELGRCDFADIALTVASTVVHRSPGRVIIDAGSKALGADRPAWTTGYGRLVDDPQARISALSEHHATVDFPAGADIPATGSVIRVIPNHVCTAVNLAANIVVVGADETDVWNVAARGANS
jgi:D-serine deaminase-like pyridoxal phosphate-dependent protein